MEPGDVPMSARPTDEEERQEAEEKKEAGSPQAPPASLLPVDVNPATSWLKFNQRVLLQATRPDFPVLERCRYVAIWSSNLDEFFQARITAFYDEAGARQEGKPLLPGHQEVLSMAQQDAILSNDIYSQLVRDLQATGIHILSPEQLNITELNYFGAFLAEKVVPRTDLLDPSSLRDVSSGLLYLAAGDRKKIKYFLRVPESLPRLLEVPSRPNAFVRVGQLMRLRKDLFLPEPLPLHEFRIVRLEGGEMARLDWDELPQALEQRAEGVVTRLDVEMSFPKAWEKELQRAFKLDDMEIFHLNPPLDYRFLFRFIESANRADLLFTPATPRKFPQFTKDPFNFIDAQDLCLYHPLDDFGTVERFVTVASLDPDVDMIRMTGYRLGRKSAMAEALMEAAKRGKDVAVLLEGRARFDELQNLYWRLHFESSGVKILPLVPNYKVHAKVLSIRHQGKTYVQVGTGNYNSANSKLYTDISLITSNPIITKDIESFFKSMEGGELPNQMQRLLYGKRIRSEMIAKIQAESRTQGHIIIKVNHLTDPEILSALVSAADAGARVDLIVRSTMTRLYHKWNMKSIVGRYLEHARISAFKCDGKWEVWAGSADWMPRNFDSRVEIFFPILNEQIKNRVLQNVLMKQTADDRNGFLLLPDGRQKSIWSGRVDAQLARL